MNSNDTQFEQNSAAPLADMANQVPLPLRFFPKRYSKNKDGSQSIHDRKPLSKSG